MKEFEVPPPPRVEPLDLLHRLEERFGAVGVTSRGELFVSLAWLYHEASSFMETIRQAAMEMNDEDGLNEVLAGLKDNLESVVHYANAAAPELRDIIGE